MLRKTEPLLVALALLASGGLPPNPAGAQTVGRIGNPSYGSASTQLALEVPPRPIQLSGVAPSNPVPGLLPDPAAAPPACSPYEDCNGPLLRGDPLLDRPEFPLPGWFAAVETGVVIPHIKNRLTAQVPVGADLVTVHVPTGELDWTGPVRIDLGYRFPQGFGEFLVSYRSLVSEETHLLGNFDLLHDPAFLKSRLNVNVVALDYASREYALGPHWDMKWKAGVRFASVYFDARAVAPLVEQRNSNDYRGLGPELGLDLWRCLGVRGLAWYGRVEAAALLGKIKQGFEEETLAGGTLVGGAQTVRGNQGVPVLGFQTGLSWAPPHHPWVRLSTGYEYEIWWYLGQVADSSAELTDQGVFFRAEVNF